MSEEWLSEEQAPGVRFSLRIGERLFRRRTAYQEIEIVHTPALGRVLTLDGRIMLTERDQAFYHEMLVHPVLVAHPCPQEVLVVGGGDGGAARAVLTHPTVRAVTVVDIDREVNAQSQIHLGSVHGGAYDDHRVQVKVAPAETFVPSCSSAFDVIIVDSTDPVGPGRALFEHDFLLACRKAVRTGGAMALQAGSPFYNPQVLSGLVTHLRRTFPCVHPYLGFVPSYPSGLWAYVLAGDGSPLLDDAILRERVAARGLVTQYYTSRLHRAAFVLPRFVEEIAAAKEER